LEKSREFRPSSLPLIGIERAFERWGHRFSPKIEEPLRLFHSLRYTPSLFEGLLRSEGFNVELLAITACREEAIWAIR